MVIRGAAPGRNEFSRAVVPCLFRKEYSVKHRIIAAAVLAAVLCLALLAACGSGEPTRKDYEAIKEGTPRSEVLEKFGEPDSGLSGFFGDIYNCGGQVVVIYYEVDYGSDTATVSKVTITKRQSENG